MKFRIGQTVRYVRNEDIEDYEAMSCLGDTGVIVSGGRYFADPLAGYDWVVAFPNYGDGSGMCVWEWQIAPERTAYDPFSERERVAC